MSTLTDANVVEMFNEREIGDAGVPLYAKGGVGYDDNDAPGFAVGDPLVRAMMEGAYKTEESVPPMMEGGGRRYRRRRTAKRTQKGGRRRRSGRSGKHRGGGKKHRFQLTLKATIRMKSRKRQQH